MAGSGGKRRRGGDGRERGKGIKGMGLLGNLQPRRRIARVPKKLGR